MIYALFMLAILIVLGAIWRRQRLAVPLFVVTLAVLSSFLAQFWVAPLTLSF